MDGIRPHEVPRLGRIRWSRAENWAVPWANLCSGGKGHKGGLKERRMLRTDAVPLPSGPVSLLADLVNFVPVGS